MTATRKDARDAAYYYELARAAARIYEAILAGPLPQDLVPQYEAGRDACLRLARYWLKELEERLQTLRDAA
ncbi:MAG: hypothetical protein Q6353_020915 [Candidatus Sigynarchaeum springense]